MTSLPPGSQAASLIPLHPGGRVPLDRISNLVCRPHFRCSEVGEGRQARGKKGTPKHKACTHRCSRQQLATGDCTLSFFSPLSRSERHTRTLAILMVGWAPGEPVWSSEPCKPPCMCTHFGCISAAEGKSHTRFLPDLRKCLVEWEPCSLGVR